MKSFKKLLKEATISGKEPDVMALPYSNTLAQNVNVREVPKGSNYGKEVTRYLKTTGLDNEWRYRTTQYDKKTGKPYNRGYAWCMAFVYTMFDDFVKKLGLSNPLPKTAGVLKHWNRADSNLKINIAEARTNPSIVKPGQIFIQSRDGGGHTGIVTSVDVDKGTFKTIEGNTDDDRSGEGNRVGRNTRKLSQSSLLGFIDYFKGNRSKKFEETVADVVANAKTDYSSSEAEGGMSKKQIEEVQAFLKSKGYDLGTSGPNKDGIDGDYGTKTKAALKDWKSKSGMSDDSVLDKEVYNLIKKGGTGETSNDAANKKISSKETQPDSIESTKEQIKKVQAFLKSKGYDLGTYGPNKDGIDGDFGTKTKTALKDWKSKSGMSDDSVLDKEVYDLIKKGSAATAATAAAAVVSSLFPNKEIKLDNFNISSSPDFEIKRAIIENTNSFKGLGELLNEKVSISNLKNSLRAAIKKGTNIKKSLDTKLADTYRNSVGTSPIDSTDPVNPDTPDSKDNTKNILKVSPQVLFIHDKKTGKFYMQPDNSQAEELIGKEKVEVSKDELGNIANSFTIEEAPASTGVTSTGTASSSNSTQSAVSGNVSHNYTGQKAKNIQLLISKAKEYGITNPHALIGILSVIGKETHFIPKKEKMVYSKERLPEVWGIFSKTGQRVSKGQGKNNYNDLAVQYAGNDQKLANFVYQEMRDPSSPYFRWSEKKDRRYGNTQPGDGYKYRGRGFNQVTFKSSYEKYAKETGIDLVNNPDLLNDVNVAADVAVKFLLNRLKQKGIDPNSFNNNQAAINTFAAANAGWGKSPNKAIANANKIAPSFGIAANNMA
jgi:predicted chitinase/peptidoglycan hydrolase-like protein with peptidoglycan-binding domain